MNTTHPDHYELAVVGEGMAGLICAARAAELGLSVATFEQNIYGGLAVNIARLLDFGDGQSGIDVGTALTESNAANGVVSVAASVSAIEPDRERFRVVTNTGRYTASSVVLATGARLRKLGVPGEERLEGHGVSQCADCDGPLFAGERVVVVGAGDAAFMQAIVLAGVASEVRILMRGDAARARTELLDQAALLPVISISPRTRVLEICGDERVQSVRVAAAGTEQKLECAGVFVYVGLEANSTLAGPDVRRISDLRIETDEMFCTSHKGIYAIGAVRAGYSGRLADAENEARIAAEHIADVHATTIAIARKSNTAGGVAGLQTR